MCFVSSSQIASSPGEKLHQNLCFFFELIILKSSQIRQRYGRSPTVLRISIILNIFQTPTHQLSPRHLPQNTSPQLNLSKLQQSALGVLSLWEEMISWTSQNILLETDNFRVPPGPEETPWCKDYIYRYSLRYEFRRLQYSIWSSLPPSAKHGDNKTSPSKSWLMALWSAVTLMWYQAINTTVPQYTTRHILEYCIFIYIATFTEINLSQLHGTQKQLLVHLICWSWVLHLRCPVTTTSGIDESLIDGIVYDERSTKASPWGNEGKGCAMVECLATW